jgi:hypothetical protein
MNESLVKRDVPTALQRQAAAAQRKRAFAASAA